MKLRAKIQLAFCATMFVIIFVIGSLVITNTKKISLSIVDDSMATSAKLAAKQISVQLEDYQNVVIMLGKDEIMRGNYSVQEKMDFLNDYVDTYGFTSVNILDAKGVSYNDGTDFSDRDYVKKALAGNANISDVAISKLTGKYGVSVAAPTYDAADKISGVVYFRLDIDFMLDVVENISISENSYAYILDQDGNVIVHPNQDMILNYNFVEENKNQKELVDDVLKGNTGNGEYEYNGESTLCGYGPVEGTNGWKIVIAAPQMDFMKPIYHMVNAMIILVVIASVVAVVVSGLIAHMISKPIKEVEKALVEVAKGNLDVNVDKSTGKDEIAGLKNTTAQLLETLQAIIGQANHVLGDIARYDLTGESMTQYPGEFNSLATSVNSIKATLSQLIVEVQNSVRNVDTGSRELAMATAALSQGTVEQASSIQAVADDLGTMVERINRNSENGEVVNTKLAALDKEIKAANDQMTALKEAVEEIETMSSSIQKIVGTIDGIAFQTNILSLNASVEAARAGEMGSGFAVVAEEVRSLAEKCGESSRKTSELIGDCIASITHAKDCADATFASLSDIVKQSDEIAQTFSEISADTVEQANESKNIQTEINTISDVIQTTTATVEETAASTEALSEQAENLETMIKNFRV